MRAVRLSVTAVIAVLAGCPGAPDRAPAVLVANDGFHGGARLRAEWFSGSGIAGPTGVFVDGETGVSCAFELAADGETRCLPVNGARETDGVQLFGDGSCSAAQRIVALDRANECAPTHVLVTDGAVCPLRSRVYVLGEEIAPAALFRRASGSSACEEAAWLIGRRRFFRLGRELDPATFVRADLVEHAAGRLVEQTRVAEDGARAYAGVRDALHGRCLPRRASDGEWRCLPVGSEAGGALLPRASGYLDPECSEPAALRAGIEAACPAPSFAWSWAFSGCRRRTLVLGVGPEAASSVYERLQGDCTSMWYYPPQQVFRVTGAALPESFALATEVSAPGARLRPSVLEFDGGTRLRVSFEDSALGIPCSLLDLAADGARRCLPHADIAASAGISFADEGCTRRLAVTSSPCPPEYALARDDATCPARVRVHEVGPPHAGPVYGGAPGVCVPQRWVGTPSFYELGPELPATDFAPVVEELR